MHLDNLMKRIGLAYKAFADVFGGRPTSMVLAPGRVHLLGEHTDYNGGYVLPLAIDLNVLLAARARPDKQVILRAVGMRKRVRFSLDRLTPQARSPWTRHIQGMAWVLQQTGHTIRGMEGVIHCTLPPNSGLGFPVALGIATAWMWNVLDELALSRSAIADLAIEAQRRFAVDVPGMADPLIITVAQDNRSLCVDCLDCTYSHHPPPHQATIVICDVSARRSKASSAYASRKKQCHTVVNMLQKHLPHLNVLRNLTPEELTRYRDTLSDLLYRRALHVVTENQRVLQGVQALEEGDMQALGRLMNRSHRSLRDDFEISSPELEAMWLAANEVDGCYGARMSGTGLGKYVVALVNRRALTRFRTHVEKRFRALTGKDATLRVVHPSGGVETI